MSRKIKTRETIKDIKVLDKSVSLAERMKDGLIKTKVKAEETREHRHNSPTEYATDNIQDKAQGAAETVVHHAPNPAHKARENMERARGHFEEARRQMPEARREAAQQAQHTADRATDNADKLRQNADQAGEKAREAKEAVRDAKQNLREVRETGRQTIRDAKMEAARGTETPRQPDMPRQTAQSSPNPAQKRFQLKRFEQIREQRRAAKQAENAVNQVKAETGRPLDASGHAGEPARGTDIKQPLTETPQTGQQPASTFKADISARGTEYKFSKPRQASDVPSQAQTGFKEKRYRIKQRNRAVKQMDTGRTLDTKGSAGEPARSANQPLFETQQVGRQPNIKGRGDFPLERGGIRTGDAVKGGQPRASDVARKNGGKLPGQSTSAAKSGVTPQKTPSLSRGKPASVSSGTTSKGVLRPTYMNKGVSAAKNTGDAAQTADKSAKTIKSASKGLKDTAKGTVKTAQKTVKTAEKSAKAAVKTAQQTAKATQKAAQASAKAAKAAAKAAQAATKAAVAAAKAAVKVTIAAVKAIIAAIKGLVAAIAAGGWVAVLVIVLICMIGLFVGSFFGIFFSGEANPDTGQNVNTVITEIDAEYTAQMDDIIASNYYDYLDMSGARAWWKNVLAVYTVRTVSDPDNPMDVAVMTDEKAAILRSVFWDMNNVSYWVETIEHIEYSSYEDDEGNSWSDSYTWYEYTLHIIVTHKTPDEMAAQYGFSDEQKEWLDELLKPEYNNLWNALLYGIGSMGDGTMISVADTQIGNVGGEIYWRWYGFDSRVEWCAIFVSFVADQCGYIDAGIIPMFAACETGIQWFKDRDQWAEPGYIPSPGDIIFFDWEPDGLCDHVGIVESVTGSTVNTIEGNSSDSVARRSYDIGSIKIFGYGIPAY